MNELAHRTETPLAPHEQRSAQSLHMIREALLNPGVSAENAKVMADLLMQMEDRDQRAEFNRDRMAAISEMPVITKDGRILIPGKDGRADRVQGRYAKLEDIDRIVKPIALRHNIAYSWGVGTDNGKPKVYIELSHANGYVWRSSGMELPIDSSGAKNNVQGVGSSMTYGERYTLCAAFSIRTEGIDDDGHGAGNISLPFEREQLVEREAREAHERGAYLAWFGEQSPKDRAWLIQSGRHVEYGGQAALPGSSPPPPPAPVDSPKPRVGHDTSTPDGWTAQFVEDCEGAQTVEDLDRIEKRGAKGLDRLAEGNQALYDKADAARVDARERLTKGE